MRHRSQMRFRRQLDFFLRRFLQEGKLPFTNVLTEETIAVAITNAGVHWLDRVYSPLVTLWVFLGQVLSSDHSCRGAVARLIAHRVSQGQPACSAETGAYCQARKRLPERFFSAVACLVGRSLDSQVDQKWLWKGRRVYMFDGTTVSMPDTPQNQEAYPQTDTQKPGLGFPIARLGAITSLSCGAILSLGFCRYAGKGQGEISLLRRMWDLLRPGDVLLTDSLLSTWTEILQLQQRGIDYEGRLNKATRKADFRKGRRLGRKDHVVRWRKPTTLRRVDRATYNSLPEFLEVRELLIRVNNPGFRTDHIIVVTTLLDAKEYSKSDLATIYRARWSNEVDLRSIKDTMQMGVLRCKTPDLIRKEVWTHILAYNLIRPIMAQAAFQHDIHPRMISFKGTIQTLEAFQPLIDLQGHRDTSRRMEIYQHLIQCVATHRVGDRPGRFEPRLRKRRPKHYAFLRKTRKQTKLDMIKGVVKI